MTCVLTGRAYAFLMKISSWNVNSIKQRLDHVIKWLGEQKSDLLLLQELKGMEFPADALKEAGYKSFAVPQKGRNGVACLYKADITDIALLHDHLPGHDPDDEQARYIEVKIGDVHVIGIYAPNGNPVDTEKFDYKLSWMGTLYDHLKDLREKRIDFVIGGDFNIIPEDKDCHDPAAWRGDALFRPESVSLYRSYIYLGLNDAYRIFDKSAEQYTFWDYQAGAWPRNNGIRIDHFLTSPRMTDALLSCTIDKEPRGWDKPSDHVPVTIELDL